MWNWKQWVREIACCQIRLDEDHIFGTCKKAGGNLNAFVRITVFVGLSKRRALMNTFLIFDLIIDPLFGCATVAK